MADLKQTVRWKSRILRLLGLSVFLTLVAAGASLVVRHWRNEAELELARRPRAAVLRKDLFVSIKAGGHIESSKRTLIECELENLTLVSSRGRAMSANGASTIISIVPDGSHVEAGDVLCELDSATYLELVRQQEIRVEEERALTEAADLTLHNAEVALKEFKDGTVAQTLQQYSGQIALSKADLESQMDRLRWTSRMVELGYMPQVRQVNEQQGVDRIELTLGLTEMGLEKFSKFGVPRTTRTLEASIEGARSRQAYQKMSLARHGERLDLYRKQVERCTVRAPHGGVVVYANENDGDTRIEIGATVRQKQDLFYLPDLGHMEVKTQIPETVVKNIRDGMPARIRVEALPNLPIEGHVVSVSSLPQSQRSWRASADVKNYLGSVQLDVVPQGIRPGLSAEVEILTDRKLGALVVPPDAVSYEDGHEYCIVSGPDGPERRVIDVGAVTADALEVLAGLNEGEEVFLEPKRFDPSRLVTPEPSEPNPASLVDRLEPTL